MRPTQTLKIVHTLTLLMLGVSALNCLVACLGKGQPPGLWQVTAYSLFTLSLCIAHGVATKGWRAAVGFSVISFGISWFVEYIGCNYGWWFGDYGYSDRLGLRVGNVPLLVVVSWEIIIYPSLLLVDHFIGRLAPGSPGRLTHRLLASLATGLVATTWDTMTDPISVRAGYWSWDFGGGYMHELSGGIPYSNFWGWVGAVFAISALYRWLNDHHTPAPPPPLPPLLFPAALFTALFLGALAGNFTYGFHAVAFVGCFTMGPVVALAWSRWWLLRSSPTRLHEGLA